MSKGLGSLQRKLIEISTATQTVWDASPNGVSFKIATPGEQTILGVTTTHENGSTWRKDGAPYYSASITISTHEDYLLALSSVRSIWFTWGTVADSLLSACWSMHHIRGTIWPDLWPQHNIKEHAKIVARPGRWMSQVPDNIKRARNAAQAGLSRAMDSLEKRGMLVPCGHTSSPCVPGEWVCHSPGTWNERATRHFLAYVLDPQLLRPGAL